MTRLSLLQGVMVRLMLVLAPVMCVLAGIAVSASLSSYMKYFDGAGVANGGVANAVGGGGQKGHKGGGGRGYKGKESQES